MTTNFNSMQMLKSSDVCGKFSKSVSYETLVIGATTTGSECGEALEIEGVITRRTSVRRGYLPEQGTHANEESLFASVTWLMRLPRRIQRMLLVMTIPALAFLLSFNLSTAFAGTTCNWDGTKLIISGSGTFNGCSGNSQRTATEVTIGTGVTSIGGSAFWNAKSLTSITIPKGVTSIGDYAFWGASSLTSITIPDSVTSIGSHAFNGATGLTSITIPDSVTGIGDRTFYGATGLTSITIPDSVTSIGDRPFFGSSSLKSIIIPDNINTADWGVSVFYGLPEDIDIVCQGDVNTCYEKLAKYIPKDKGGNCTNSDFCIKKEILPAQSSQCNGSYIYENGNCHKRNEEQCNATDKYYYNGATCLYRPRNRQVTCVNPNYKANDGYCDRLRYTPAEAAQVLRDDNTNSVTITFKK